MPFLKTEGDSGSRPDGQKHSRHTALAKQQVMESCHSPQIDKNELISNRVIDPHSKE